MPIRTQILHLHRRVAGSRVGYIVASGAREWQARNVSRNVAAITFYSLLSLFPLLHLVRFALDIANTISPDLATSVGDAIGDDLGVLGDSGVSIDDARTLTAGGIAAAVISVPLAVWGATRAFSTLSVANDDLWYVAAEKRLSGPARRVSSLLGLGVFAGRVGVVVVGGALAIRIGGWSGWLVYGVVDVAANLWVVYGLMRLGSVPRHWRVLWPGVVAGAIGFAGLQLWGTTLAQQWSSDASSTHAATVGLLAIMWGHVLVVYAGACAVAVRRDVLLRRTATRTDA